MNGHEIAIWSGVAAFFSSLLAIGIVDIFNPNEVVKFLSSLLVAGITAGAVYSKQRLDDAKSKKGGDEDISTD